MIVYSNRKATAHVLASCPWRGADRRRVVSVLLWPFVALWRLVALVLVLTGRLIGITLGVVLVLAGGLISITGIGLVIGVPLMGIGFLLIARGLF